MQNVQEKDSSLTRDNYYTFGNSLENMAVSNSALSKINPDEGGSFDKFEKYILGESQDEAKAYYFNGKLLHYYIEHKDEFCISEVNKPTPAVAKVVENLYEYDHDFSSRGEILDVCNTLKYQSGWNPDTRVDKILEEGTEYYNFLVENSDKICLTPSEKEQILHQVTAIEQSDYRDVLIDDPTVERERAILFNLSKIFKSKALIDNLKSNHDRQTAHITDLKTSSKPISTFHHWKRYGYDSGRILMKYFDGPFFTYRYYRQLAHYVAAVKSLYPTYKITASIIVVESMPPYSIKEFVLTEEEIEMGMSEVWMLIRNVEAFCTYKKIGEF